MRSRSPEVDVEHLIGPAIGLGASLLVFLLIGPIRQRLAGRREQRITAGRPVSFAARVAVDGGKLRRARLTRDGDRIVVRTMRGGYAAPVTRERIVATRVDDPDSPVGEWRMERHTDERGRVVEIGTLAEDRRALAALRAAPTARRPRVAGWAWWVAAVLGIGAVLLTLFYGLSYQATGTVRAVNDGADSCMVEWTHGGQVRLTHVDCGSYDAAAVGDTLPITAQPAPFEGQAVSGPRSDIFGIDGMIAAAAGLVVLAGAWRARGPRHPAPLRPVVMTSAPTSSAASASAASSGHPASTSLVALAQAVTAAEGWLPAADRPGFRPSPRTDIAGAVTGIGWWTPVLLLVAASVSDIAPAGLRPVAWGLTVLAVLVQVVRAFVAWRSLHALWRQPFSSEWDAVGLPAPEGYAVLLSMGPYPHWLVEIGTMPPVSCRMRVRGTLGDGGLVHLAPSGTDVLYLGHPTRMTAEVEDDVRAFLRARDEESVPDFQA